MKDAFSGKRYEALRVALFPLVRKGYKKNSPLYHAMVVSESAVVSCYIAANEGSTGGRVEGWKEGHLT